MKRQRRYLSDWAGTPHPDHDAVVQGHDRTLQVWECKDEGFIYFVVGPPEVLTYEEDGKPFQFDHACMVLDESGELIDWPLVETLDRPLEAKVLFRRLL